MDQWTEEEFNGLLIEAVRRAAMDGTFRQRLMGESRATLQELASKPLPENYEVCFTEDTASRRTVVLPPLMPSDGELTPEELERVAGGVCFLTIEI